MSSSFSAGQGQTTSSSGSNWNWSIGHGDSQSVTNGYSTSTTMEDVLQAHHFTSLRSGSDADRGLSEAIIFRTGRVWSNRETFLHTQFSRHLA